VRRRFTAGLPPASSTSAAATERAAIARSVVNRLISLVASLGKSTTSLLNDGIELGTYRFSWCDSSVRITTAE
jgi:hypothetical protein